MDVFTRSWQGDIPSGLNVRAIPSRALSNHSRRIALASEVLRHTQDQNYDAVVGFSKMPGLDYYFAGDSCFAEWAAGKPFWYRFTGRCRNYLALERAVFKPDSQSRILLLVEKDRTTYQRYYATPSERFHLLPPGIERDRLAPHNTEDIRRQVKMELGITEETHMVLMVGSGFRTKGTDRAMRAFAGLPDAIRDKAVMVIIGKDNFRPFGRLARRLGISNQIHFFNGRHDVPRFLFSADLLLHPAYRETAGIVLIESMAAGLPVLATDVCGYSSYIQQAGAGRLVPSPFNQNTLNRTLAEMLTSTRRSNWSANGQKYVLEHDVFSMHARAVDFIEATVPC
ncbi:UDP-glucose--(heptosyl) LPS alpha 1,3-glucosyltransferase WaaG [Desulfosarcina ovata subsp. ovata]|uniref:UDP-glucose--(Heptosyl) LPS alpha 1,3-glucosyltransferase WaaG n=1 Tax=Desulfosarcina ovata subsp. ovata TaxID=2752305 RepID=A0A5K8A6K1_9BACT|nr:UDP-glucose--(heptosyl) LPS alpha 1,3-glucosyltransferase WaaG [Desulfosarcina ovata subsp. ovata]